MGDLRLAEVTVDNLRATLKVSGTPEQATFVAPVVHSLAEAYVVPAAWPRVVLDGEQPVGFVMVHFHAENERESRRAYLWRLNVDATAQRRGIGTYAVEQVIAEARRRGADRLYVSYVCADGGPEDFYRRLGFVPTGVIDDGETEAALDL